MLPAQVQPQQPILRQAPLQAQRIIGYWSMQPIAVAIRQSAMQLQLSLHPTSSSLRSQLQSLNVSVELISLLSSSVEDQEQSLINGNQLLFPGAHGQMQLELVPLQLCTHHQVL